MTNKKRIDYDRVFPIDIKKWELPMVICIGILIIFGIVYKAGSLETGYHFLDDHEIIRQNEALRTASVPLHRVIGNTIRGDLWWRFRPFYWVERILSVYFFGTEFIYWNYYIAIKGVITFCLLYFTARYLKHPRVISLLFPCVIMLGHQFTPWYRNGNQESLGLLLCAFTLLMIAMQHYYKKYRGLVFNILIVIGAILCGLSKESFTLMMPVFIAMKLWLEFCRKEERPSVSSFLSCFRSNMPVYLSILIAMGIHIYMIVFQVGIDNVSYAGFHKGTPLLEYWQHTCYNLTVYLRSYYLLGPFLLFLAEMCHSNVKKLTVWKYLGGVVICIYILATQLLLHAKSFMWERYIIPWIVGYAFLFVLIGFRYFQEDTIQRLLFIAIISVFVMKGASQSYSMALSYALDGQAIQDYFQCILEHTEADSKIICAFYDGELNLATESYLEVHDRTHVYTYSDAEHSISDMVKFNEENSEELSWANAAVGVCYGYQEEEIANLMGFSEKSEYTAVPFGNYCVIYGNVD